MHPTQRMWFTCTGEEMHPPSPCHVCTIYNAIACLTNTMHNET